MLPVMPMGASPAYQLTQLVALIASTMMEALVQPVQLHVYSVIQWVVYLVLQAPPVVPQLVTRMQQIV